MKSYYIDVKVKASKRIYIIKGQLDGLQRMIKDFKMAALAAIMLFLR